MLFHIKIELMDSRIWTIGKNVSFVFKSRTQIRSFQNWNSVKIKAGHRHNPVCFKPIY